MKTVSIKQANSDKWKVKGKDQAKIDRGISTVAITRAMNNLDKTMVKVDNMLELNLSVSKKLLSAVEVLTAKINPT